MTSGPGSVTLLDLHDALLLDLDGVVYVGPLPVQHAVDALTAVRSRGLAIAYVTNNAARPPSVVAEHLRSFGLVVDDADVVTSAQAGAREVAARVPAGSRVLAVGGPGVGLALEAQGLVPVSSALDRPMAVLMGYGPDVSWRDLAEAAYAVGAGTPLVATNTDLSIPTERGVAPGNGTLVSAVVSATGVEPAVVAGKPFEPLVRESVERVAARRPLIVGDRLDTDIEAGHRSGIPTLLVLTGVHGVVDLLAATPDRRPTYLAADLRGLDQSVATVALAPTEGAGGPDDGLAALRSACGAAWAAADAGGPPPALDIEALRADVTVALSR